MQMFTKGYHHPKAATSNPMALPLRGAKTAFEQSNAMKPIKAGEMAVKNGEQLGWYGKRWL